MSSSPYARSHKPTGFSLEPTHVRSTPIWANFRRAALFWHEFGFAVIPVVPGSKKPAVTWDSWLTGLVRLKIDDHWRSHPAHELGVIVGDKIVVFDADSPESVSALNNVESKHGIVPLLVVKTTRGEHHYYRLADDTSIRTAAYCTRDFPERVDVKTGRSLVILPPSTGKSIVNLEVSHASEFSVASQPFIEALTKGAHNTPKTAISRPPSQTHEVVKPTLRSLQAALNRLDPDLPYGDWFRVAAVVFHETAGGNDGYGLFDRWSATGRKYKGVHDTGKLWKALRPDHPKPLTIATLRFLLTAEGHDWTDICAEADETFTLVDEEVAQ